MTREEIRGRRIVLTIVGVVVCLTLFGAALVFAAGQPERQVVALVQTAIIIAMCWCLYVGYRWARAYVPATFLLSGVHDIVRAFASRSVFECAVWLLFATGFIGAALLVWAAPSVAAHFARVAGPREAVLSLKGNDGV